MTSSEEESNGAAVDNGTEPPWKLARKGITLLLNNKNKEAEELFLKYPDSLVMYAGYSFAVFMDALMSFEEDKLTKAVSTLKELERKCSNQNGWIKTISKKVFGNGNEEAQSLAEQLENQIVLADSQVCIAILTFLQQDLSGYFKGGWVLRKAWKVYQKTYRDILELYKERIGELQLPDPAPLSPAPFDDDPALSEDQLTADWAYSETTINGSNLQIDKKTIVRLMGAISFGYGLFQLGISLLPPSLMRLVSILGFAASRQNGIECLMYARVGLDMRAPLASLSLLWYHTIVRPFYAIDGTNVRAGVEAASGVLRESREEFADSALFLFFNGRVGRLNSDIPQALRFFQQASENANQREIKILAMHETGWCHLIQLDYENSRNTFLYLKCASRWSRAFYGYLTAICTGATGNFLHYEIFDDLKACMITSKGGQLDVFLNRRLACCPQDVESAKALSAIYYKLLVFEMLYLWNALGSCSVENVNKILEDCTTVETSRDEPRRGITNLIRGICFCVLKKYTDGIRSFKRCLEERKDEPFNAEDAHISAFAQFEWGYVLLQQTETKEEGRNLLQQVGKYTHYDFEGRLSVRIHSTLKHSN